MRKWPAWLPNESCKIRTQAEQKLVQFLYFFQLRLVKLKNEYIPLANMSLDKSLCGIHKKNSNIHAPTVQYVSDFL